MTLHLSLALTACTLGLAMYLLPLGPKSNEVGRIAFALGLLAILLPDDYIFPPAASAVVESLPRKDSGDIMKAVLIVTAGILGLALGYTHEVRVTPAQAQFETLGGGSSFWDQAGGDLSLGNLDLGGGGGSTPTCPGGHAPTCVTCDGRTCVYACAGRSYCTYSGKSCFPAGASCRT